MSLTPTPGVQPFAPGRWLRPIFYVLSAAICVLCLLAIAGMSGTPAPKQDLHPSNVEVDSRSSAVDASQVRSRIEQLRFAHPTQVGVLVREGSGGEDIEEAARAAARESHPDWFEGSEWAGYRVVIYLNITDPAGHGDSGVYWGAGAFDHGHSSASTMRKAGTAAFKDARWDDGLVDIAAAAATPSSGKGAIVVLGLVVAVFVVLSAVLAWRAHARHRRFDAALAALGAAAEQLPAKEAAQRGLLRRYAGLGSVSVAMLRRGVDEWTRAAQEVGQGAQVMATYTPGVRRSTDAGKEAEHLQDTASGMDYAQVGLADAARILAGEPGWPEALGRQCSVLAEDAQSGLALAQARRKAGSSQALDQAAQQTLITCQRLPQDAAAGRIDGPQAMQVLADAALHVSTAAQRVSEELVDRKAGKAEARQEQAQRGYGEALASVPPRSRAFAGSLLLPAQVNWRPVAAHAVALTAALAALTSSANNGTFSSGGGGGGGSSSGSF